MSRIAKFLAVSTMAALVAAPAMAGGLSDAVVEDEPLVQEDQPVGSLGLAAPLILIALIAAGAAGGSSNGTTQAN